MVAVVGYPGYSPNAPSCQFFVLMSEFHNQNPSHVPEAFLRAEGAQVFGKRAEEEGHEELLALIIPNVVEFEDHVFVIQLENG